MKKLLSLPINLVNSFASLDPRYATDRWFVTSDPTDRRLGSGAGTAWLLDRWEQADPRAHDRQKRIIIHAGGQSRRLPAYATSGKVLTPIPVLRWAVGQQIDQTLLSLQMPLYQRLMSLTSDCQNTLIASGDVYLHTDVPISSVPEADVVCYGLWADPQLASHHGVFVTRKNSPATLDHMLQKPSPDTLNSLAATHYYMMDIGLWILSDRAVDLLRRRSHNPDGSLTFYDLYSQFGCALGDNPSAPDPELADLSVAITPLPGGEFYHFGTTRELLSSTLALQNKVTDQRLILNRKSKSNPAIFTQNCNFLSPINPDNHNIWIENSHIGPKWQLTSDNVVTGVPENDWSITLDKGVCLDLQPIGDRDFAIRPYGFDDPMRGPTGQESTIFLGQPLTEWLGRRGVDLPDGIDIQSAPLFPLTDDPDQMQKLIRWMTSDPDLPGGRDLWLSLPRLSADQISDRASLPRLFNQRRQFLKRNIAALADNYERSIFYQLDLDHLSQVIADNNLRQIDPLPESAPLVQRMRNHMLRAQTARHLGDDASTDDLQASQLMADGILSTLDNARAIPRLSTFSDQIVWGRSPVRIDLAGGWTDTPPYSILRGGNVVNTAIELNGQPPLQVFVKPCAQHHILIRSIDLGASEIVETYDQLTDYRRVGSPFSIPKAALSLCGFAPKFCPEKYDSLRSQLIEFGSGIEITLLSAIPAGSGLGTSSILSATVIGALSDFCSLAWDVPEICRRTLALEQLLTTGGGWQDQYGGVLQGTKLLQTAPGWDQEPRTSWLPDGIFTDPQVAPCHLLYYTGITRTAKSILAEIVRRMYLNSSSTIALLDRMRHHTLDMAQAIQRRDFTRYGHLIAETWKQNCRLDSGTNPPQVEALINRVSDLLLGYKLPGAGGGGYLYMVAKDPDAASRVRRILTEDPLNANARMVDMSISSTGLQISRS